MHRPDDAAGVARRFGARMLPLAALVGVLVAVLPPASYAVNARNRLFASADRNAARVAHEIGSVVSRQPDLWVYNTPKVVQALRPFRDSGDVVRVTVRGCDGAIRFDSERLGFRAPEGTDLVARRAIRGPGGVVGWVDVGVDTMGERAILRVWTVASVGLGAALAILLFGFPTRTVRSSAGRLEETNQALERARAELAETNRTLERRVEAARAELRKLADAAVDEQESERERIARDLHDSLGQHLAAQRLALDRVGDALPDAELERMRSINRSLFEDLRRAIHDLGPAVLDSRSLGDALRARCEEFEVRAGLPVSVRIDAGLDAPTGVARALVHVLQEALTNVARHAGASEVGVRCRLDGEAIELEVRDDGRGWPAKPTTSGTGLAGMQTRLTLLGGTIERDANPGGGAILRARVPDALSRDRE